MKIKRTISLILASIVLLTSITHSTDKFPTLKSNISGTYNNKLNKLFKKDDIIPIAIIGSGPAGLTAALYGARGGIPTVVFTGNILGGQLTQTTYIENWPGSKQILGTDITDGLFEQIKEFNVQVVEDNIIKVDFDNWPFTLYTESGKTATALSVIVATGGAPRKLGIKGESEYFGRGVSSCAVCDCHFFKNKTVAIVGGGDSAVEEAMQLAPYASNIFILIRDTKMKATKAMQNKLEDFDNVKIIYNKQILQIIGNGETVTGLKIKDIITDEQEMFPVDGLFLAIGQNPNTNLFKNFLKLNKLGYIVIDPLTHETSTSGVFAAGDIEDSEYRQAIVAAASGCKSALRAVKWLREIGLTDKFVKNLSKNYFNHLK